MQTHHMPSVVKCDKGDVSGTFTSLLGPSSNLAVGSGKVGDRRCLVSRKVLRLEVVDHSRTSNVVDHCLSDRPKMKIGLDLRISASPE